ncbi:hypothetical protein F511_26948 [Dorcoceras hygrometricum]|uniref:Uncharacterized protein n=1 Tax=Dorcoceras hygrometricum TaxID=472368 RepID=A0A2Z7AJL9_9LAMI|nr:hypothetical protein F511_26948 [Dorcoceras hygrometricum]
MVFFRSTKFTSSPEPQPPRSWKIYWQLRCDALRVMDSFTIAGPTSGPDLNYTYSYTSILRLGLAAGDTPDAPQEHLGTRRPSTTASALPTPSEARAIKRRAWSSRDF